MDRAAAGAGDSTWSAATPWPGDDRADGTDTHARASPEAELALYREAVEGLPQGLCLFGPDGRIRLVNRRYAELMQIDAAALRPGMTERDLARLAIEAGHYP